MKLQLYCTCGAAWMMDVQVSADAFKAAWDAEHIGPGHAPCDARTAARARAKAEREEAEKAK